MKIHHKRVHGESIAKVESECNNCSSTFEYYESDGRKGEYCSDCVGQWDNGHSADMIESECPQCGRVKEFKPFQYRQRKTDYCRSCWDRTGENNPNWKGGNINYYGEDWKEIREQVRQRDGNICQVCGATEEDFGVKPHVHHIEPVRSFEKANDAHTMSNLIQLCPVCHGKAEGDKIDLKNVKD